MYKLTWTLVVDAPEFGLRIMFVEALPKTVKAGHPT
jgi:hypothetical protein